MDDGVVENLPHAKRQIAPGAKRLAVATPGQPAGKDTDNRCVTGRQPYNQRLIAASLAASFTTPIFACKPF